MGLVDSLHRHTWRDLAHALSSKFGAQRVIRGRQGGLTAGCLRGGPQLAALIAGDVAETLRKA